MSIGEIVVAVVVVAWILLNLVCTIGAFAMVPTLLRECRSYPALALAWIVLLGAVLMAARAEFGGGAVWERIVWWTLALLAGAFAVFGPELRSCARRWRARR